jgi:hypothetical protein
LSLIILQIFIFFPIKDIIGKIHSLHKATIIININIKKIPMTLYQKKRERNTHDIQMLCISIHTFLKTMPIFFQSEAYKKPPTSLDQGCFL